ncbi:hypothetical protein BDV40DRAFT_276808 [Aspergillus tamarii]|uniref:Uncharacterized protein n=1 Tax=Aspergillus tamarii TaxID=41984 RepID=A0A5N6UHD6_ASPTM|nr:hypothetical protein BDV40DRAFT_276808 [Aspergillus tamarii]
MTFTSSKRIPRLGLKAVSPQRHLRHKHRVRTDYKRVRVYRFSLQTKPIGKGTSQRHWLDRMQVIKSPERMGRRPSTTLILAYLCILEHVQSAETETTFSPGTEKKITN